jgi:fucose permease
MFHLLLAIIYLSFISLGLPDSVLGAAWPSMYQEFGVPVSYAGIISMIISVGTIVSSLQSDRLTRRLGTGKVTAISVGMTAVALFGFSVSHSFIALCLWAVPYGLGAGSVDASLNNYVALHYASRHMSWLHCMWGVGAASGPYIMGFALLGGGTWNSGYRYISLIQVVLTVALFCSLPLWKGRGAAVAKAGDDALKSADGVANGTEDESNDALESADGGDMAGAGSDILAEADDRPLTLREIFAITGAKEIMVAFFCYCAIESTAGLWASSYLVLHHGVDAQTAAGLASLFYIGITVGRAINGFLTIKFTDTQMIRTGQAIIFVGLLILLFSPNSAVAFVGLILVGLGCAPVYPCIIHSTPAHFGADKSQAIIGVQMASAYTGTCLMPPVFGLIANHVSVALYPAFMGVILVLMVVMYQRLLKIKA